MKINNTNLIRDLVTNINLILMMVVFIGNFFIGPTKFTFALMSIMAVLYMFISMGK